MGSKRRSWSEVFVSGLKKEIKFRDPTKYRKPLPLRLGTLVGR
jgi:hypothetical protein